MLKMPVPDIPVELDPAQAWPAQGDWTYADYLRLPDDGNRYEIIHGVLHVQAAPGTDHQYTAGRLFAALNSFVVENNLGMVFFAPYEVHLKSIARPVQPDLLFVAAENAPKAGDPALMAAPDLVIEVFSPSTRRHDMTVKLTAYEQGGVRECWLVDPVLKAVTVFALPEGGRQYALIGVFAGQEAVKSTVLSGLEVLTATLFLA